MLFNVFKIAYTLKNSFDFRVGTPLIIVTIFCFGYILLHPFKSPAASLVSSSVSYLNDSVDNQSPINVVDPQSVPSINSMAMNDDPFNVAGSIQTLTLQQQSTSNVGLSSNAGIRNNTPTGINPSNLDSLNIVVPPDNSASHSSRSHYSKNSIRITHNNNGNSWDNSNSSGYDLFNNHQSSDSYSQQW